MWTTPNALQVRTDERFFYISKELACCMLCASFLSSRVFFRIVSGCTQRVFRDVGGKRLHENLLCGGLFFLSIFKYSILRACPCPRLLVFLSAHFPASRGPPSFLAIRPRYTLALSMFAPLPQSARSTIKYVRSLLLSFLILLKNVC